MRGDSRSTCSGEDVALQDGVAVLSVRMHAWSAPGQLAELLGPGGFGIDEVVLMERRVRIERDERAALDSFAGRLRKVVARAGVRVNINPAQAADLVATPRFHDFRVRSRLLAHDGQLDL